MTMPLTRQMSMPKAAVSPTCQALRKCLARGRARAAPRAGVATIAARAQRRPTRVSAGWWAVVFMVTCALVLYGGSIQPVAAQGQTATFFVAHRDTHTEAMVYDPLPAPGGQPVVFEVRIRDASDEKAGWQTMLMLDACEFLTPASADIVLGDMFEGAVPVLQVLPVENDVISIRLGQVYFNDSVSARTGLLATITLQARAGRDCPSGATGSPNTLSPALSVVRFAGLPDTQWFTPDSQKLPFTTRPGYLNRRAAAVTLSAFTAFPVSRTPLGPLVLIVSFCLVFALIAHKGGSIDRDET